MPAGAAAHDIPILAAMHGDEGRHGEAAVAQLAPQHATEWRESQLNREVTRRFRACLADGGHVDSGSRVMRPPWGLVQGSGILPERHLPVCARCGVPWDRSAKVTHVEHVPAAEVRAELARLGLSVREAADALQVSPSRISEISTPSADVSGPRMRRRANRALWPQMLSRLRVYAASRSDGAPRSGS